MQSNEKIADHYELCGQLGQGGFARVYKAIDKKTGKEVAIKMINKKQIKSSKMTERVKQEVSLHYRLSNPNVLQLIDASEDKNYVYLILEYCEKGDLSHLLKQRRAPFDEEETRSYMRQVVAGMTYLHNNKIMHRDISLGNLLINKDGVLKIADFGLAKQNNTPEEKNITMCGTPNFICPEIASRAEHGPEADVWSMGVLMFTLLTGKPPFETDGPAYKTLERVKNGDYVMPDSLSPEARDLIACMLRKEPKERITLSKIAEHPFMIGKKIISSAMTQQQHHHRIIHTPSPILSPENSAPLTHHHNFATSYQVPGVAYHGNTTSSSSANGTNNNIAASSSSLSSSSHHSLKSMTGGLANTTNTGASGSFNESIDSGRGTLTTSSSSMPHNVLLSSTNSRNNNNIPTAFHMTATHQTNNAGYMTTSAEQHYELSKLYANSLATKLGSVAISSNMGGQVSTAQHQQQQQVPNPHSYQMSYGQNQSMAANSVLPRSASSYAASMSSSASSSSSNSSSTNNNNNNRPCNNRYSLKTPLQHPCHNQTSSIQSQQQIGGPYTACASPPVKLHSPTREKSYFQTGHFQSSTSQPLNSYAQLSTQCLNTTTSTQANTGVNGYSQRPSEAVSTSSQTDKQKIRLLSPPRLGSTLLKPNVHMTDKYKVYYLDGNQCVVEWFKGLRKKNGEYRDQVARFDFGKGLYMFYEADCVPNSERPPEPTNPRKVKTFSHDTLPECYWKKLNMAVMYTKIVLSKMPKVTCYTSEARCVLGHSGDFDMEFYETGVKISLTANGTSTRVIMPDNHSFYYDLRSPTAMLPYPLTPACLKEMVELAYERYQYCKEEEELREARWRQNPSACQAFPITIGQKPSNSTSATTTPSTTTHHHAHHHTQPSTTSRSSSNRPYNHLKYSTAMPHRASSQALH